MRALGINSIGAWGWLDESGQHHCPVRGCGHLALEDGYLPCAEHQALVPPAVLAELARLPHPYSEADGFEAAVLRSILMREYMS